MGGNMKELTLREKILVLLADGQWHLFGEILHTLGKEIMPERATQIYYTAHHKHANDRESITKKSMDEKIQLGRSRIISKIIQDLRRCNTIETRGLHGKQKMLIVGSEVKLKCGTSKELISYLNVFNNMIWTIKDEANREIIFILIEIIRQRLIKYAEKEVIKKPIEEKIL